MENWWELIEPFAIGGTFLLSFAGVFISAATSRTQQQSAVMNALRSDRIQKMREHSAKIITCSRLFHYELADDGTKAELLEHSHKLISLLQYYYEYKTDIQLIETIHEINELCLAEKVDKAALFEKTKAFWWIINVYLGADFERLKNESSGKINPGGMSRKEATDFALLYQKYDHKEAPENTKKKKR